MSGILQALSFDAPEDMELAWISDFQIYLVEMSKHWHQEYLSYPCKDNSRKWQIKSNEFKSKLIKIELSYETFQPPS